MEKTRAAIFISLCYLLFTFGYVESRGFYHVGELIILIATYFLVTLFYFKPQFLSSLNIPSDKHSQIFILILIMIVNIAQVGANLGDSAQTNWLVFCAAIIRLFSIFSSPNPPTDIFYILRDGPKLLFRGINPYELNYPSPYGVYIPTIVFHYGPLAPFVFLPSSAIFNDPRFTLILVDLLAAFVIYRLGRHLKVDDQITKLLVIIYLFHPFFGFMTEHAWPEPLSTLFLLLAVYFTITRRQSILVGTFLGFILSIKSVYVLPLVTYLANTRAKFYQFLLAIGIPIALSAPFLLANRQLFLDRTQIYVTNPEKIATVLAPTNISLSISAVILKYTHIMLPTAAVVIPGLAISFLSILKKSPNVSFALLSTFIVFFTLFMLGPFVFLYNFAFLGNILLISILLFSAR